MTMAELYNELLEDGWLLEEIHQAMFEWFDNNDEVESLREYFHCSSKDEP